MAQAEGGRFLLRIEDIDRQRCRSGFAAELQEDLAWLGLTWEQPVRRQSEHFSDYSASLDRLKAMEVVYPCFCSRKDIAAAGYAPHLTSGGLGGDDGPVYPGLCRDLSLDQREAMAGSGRPYAWRLNMVRALTLTGLLVWHDRAAGPQRVGDGQLNGGHLGDIVLARKDTPASYHLCVTTDDALQEVTLVSRGRDLFHATHSHRVLQALLGLPVPEYHHHDMLSGTDGVRLSKRDGALALRALRDAGHSSAAVRAMAGFADV